MTGEHANHSAARSEIKFRRYNAVEARQRRNTVETVYVRSYVDAIASGDPFDSVEAFMHRFDSYTSQATFDLVIAYRAAEAIGQTWGWPLTKSSRFWEGLLTKLEPGFTNENGRRTFALSEIMVSQGWTGKGVARALHDQLLSGRAESRAVLLVEPDNTRAYRAYLHWGWSKVAQLRPNWENAPMFDVLTLPLDRT